MMTPDRPTLSLADARDLPVEDLIERAELLLAWFDSPDIETQSQKIERIGRTIDEIPQLYRWFLQLFSFADHWTDSFNEMWGRQDRRYKTMRQRRDLFEHMASAAKMRYEATSRLITLMEGFDASGMPRTRRISE